FVSTFRPLDHYLKLKSSGSTGEPHKIYHNTAALFQNSAHSARERSIMALFLGKSVGYRASIISTPTSALRNVLSFCQKRSFFPSRLRIERQFLLLTDPPEKNVPLLNEFRPDLLHAYGSYLEILFHYLYTTGRPFHRPKLVMYGGDALSDSVR